MTTGRQVLAGVCLLVVLSAGVAPVTAAPQPAATEAGVFQQEFDADSVLMEIAVHENGTAEWTVRYRLALETDNETAAFEELQADIRANESAYVGDFETRMQATVADAENATGREMAATDFDVTTSQQPVSESGFVTYTFTWESFAAVDGSTISIGDAIAGLYLDGQTTLTVSWPEDYEPTRVVPEPDQRSDSTVTWDGRRSFGAEEPRVVVAPAGGGLGDLLPLVVGAAIAVAILGGGVVLYRRRRGASTPAPTAGDAGSGGGGGAPDTSGTGDTEPPSDLLSNEERVTRLLEAHGGRMKQQAVVSELGWTEAKTSQVVNAMQDDGELEVFRIGRENVLKLPDENGEDE